MPVSAEGRVEHQKRTQTAALLSFGFVFGVQLGSLEKKLRREPVRAVMVHMCIVFILHFGETQAASN